MITTNQRDSLICAKALIYCKIAETYFLLEQYKDSFIYYKEAEKFLDLVDEGLKLRFMNTIQLIYIKLGLISGTEQESIESALEYF